MDIFLQHHNSVITSNKIKNNSLILAATQSITEILFKAGMFELGHTQTPKLHWVVS